MPMWIELNFFKYMTGVILVLLAILLAYYDVPVFYLILWFSAAIFLPILFSTLLYYIMRPAVNKLSQWMPRYLSILLLYFVLFWASVVLVYLLLPEFSDVANRFSSSQIEEIKNRFYEAVDRLKSYFPHTNLAFVENLFINNLPKINVFVYQSVVGVFTAVTGLAIAIGLTPFILYYFLRDDLLFSRFVLQFVPLKYRREVEKIMHDIDVTLSGFISTQATIALIVGSFLFIGYLVVGLPYALPLALFAMLFYVIPFLGTFIAIIPALIVAVSIHLSMIVKVIIIMLLAHLIEAYLITPRLMSYTLKIHPLTIILLLLVGGSLFGIIGLILITPAYSIIKVFVWNIYKITQLRVEEAKFSSILSPDDKQEDSYD